MEWRQYDLDVVLVPMAILIGFAYNLKLWYTVKNDPLKTTIGINSIGRKLWLQSMIKDNEKKNIILVQTLRNNIMVSTLMATTSILLCAGLAGLLSSTYGIKKALYDTTLGGQGQMMVTLKYISLLIFFVSSFSFHTLSVKFLNQVTYVANTITLFKSSPENDGFEVSFEFSLHLMEKGFLYNTVGNRLFYMALPLFFWTFGPVLVLVSSAAIITVLWNLDFNLYPEEDESSSWKVNGEMNQLHEAHAC